MDPQRSTFSSTEFLIVLLKDRMTLALKGMRIKEDKGNQSKLFWLTGGYVQYDVAFHDFFRTCAQYFVVWMFLEQSGRANLIF